MVVVLSTDKEPISVHVQMTLYEAGKDAMEKEFRNLLARHGRPVPPGSLLDVLALEHGSRD